MSKKTALLYCKPANSKKVEIIDGTEVLENNEVCCPPFDECLWNSHPRVYLKLNDKGEVLCPYCGTLYTLKVKDE